MMTPAQEKTNDYGIRADESLQATAPKDILEKGREQASRAGKRVDADQVSVFGGDAFLPVVKMAAAHARSEANVEGDLERLERDGLEVVHVDAAREELGLGVLGHEPRDEVGSDGKLLLGPVEERGHLAAVGHADLARAKLVEEGVAERLDGGETRAGRVLEQSGDEVDGVGRRARTEDLGEGMRSDLGELVLHVVGVHGLDLLARGRAEHLDDLDELIDAALAGEERLPLHELGHDAACGPDVDVGGVIGGAKDELGSSVVPGADVADVGLAGDEDLGGAKVAELEDAGRGVEQQVLRLDVAVADADGVDLGVVARGTVDGLWDVLEDEVEEDLVLLVAVGVEEGLEVDDVGVLDDAHDLELAVLEALVLKNLFDGDLIAVFAGAFGGVGARGRHEFCLEDDTEASVADDLAVGVGDFSLLGGLAVRGKDLDHLVGVIERCETRDTDRGWRAGIFEEHKEKENCQLKERGRGEQSQRAWPRTWSFLSGREW
ncbi:hypothetical protein L1887_48040 [Cichorium endivia]|nr:hypothetical protein L1887_48040 [Cichorium endivia]